MKLRTDALAIFDAALKASDPAAAVRRHMGPPDEFSRYRKIWVVGAGKASAAMAAAVEELLPDRIEAGVVAVKDGHLATVHKIQLRECSHPVPDERGVAVDDVGGDAEAGR